MITHGACLMQQERCKQSPEMIFVCGSNMEVTETSWAIKDVNHVVCIPLVLLLVPWNFYAILEGQWYLFFSYLWKLMMDKGFEVLVRRYVRSWIFVENFHLKWTFWLFGKTWIYMVEYAAKLLGFFVFNSVMKNKALPVAKLPSVLP